MGETLKILFSIYRLEISLLILFILIAFVLEQKFKFDKPKKWFIAFNALLFQRGFSAIAYYVPYLDMINTHIPLLRDEHPLVLRLFLPNFVADSIDVVQQIPFLSFVYISLGYGLCIRYKIPKDRFIRYNVMYSIMLISLQGIINDMFITFIETVIFDTEIRSNITLLSFFLWLALYIPCFVRSFAGKYDENKFIREAVEVHLGRDGPDFIWWDRRKKGKKDK